MKKKSITAREFDEKFESGEDVLPYCDEIQESIRVNVDFPAWAVKALDTESSRRGIARQSLIKMWIIDMLDEIK